MNTSNTPASSVTAPLLLRAREVGLLVHGRDAERHSPSRLVADFQRFSLAFAGSFANARRNCITDVDE